MNMDDYMEDQWLDSYMEDRISGGGYDEFDTWPADPTGIDCHERYEPDWDYESECDDWSDE